MIGADFAETEARIDRVMGFIRDTVASADVSEPAGRGAGWSVDYDEASIRAFILEVMVGVALPLPLPDLGGHRRGGTYRPALQNPAQVIRIEWEINGERQEAVPGHETPPGASTIWIMRNGQEVRATWKPAPPAPDPTFRPPLVSSPEACWPEEEVRAAHAAKRAKP